VPKLIALTPVPEPETVVQLKEYELRVKVPSENASVPLAVKSLPKFTSIVEALKVRPEQTAPETVEQTPEPDKELKIATSPEVGADAPAAPPVVADQFAVLEASQVPVPPTQNLLAIINLRSQVLVNLACEAHLRWTEKNVPLPISFKGQQ
jgi:hypothetical protein